jgi:hypothetical protein
MYNYLAILVYAVVLTGVGRMVYVLLTINKEG